MDFSKLTETQRKELEQLQKQFQEHQAQQQKQQEESAAAAAAAAAAASAAVQQPPPAYDPSQVQQPPPAYDPSQVQQSYGQSQGYDQSYYYNYHYQDPSQQQQPPPQQQQQYDPAYYQTGYSNAYQQQQQYPHPETSAATAYTAPIEQKGNEGSGSGGQVGVGQMPVQDPYFDPNNQVNSGGTQPNPGYPVPPGLNAAAAAAVAALSQLTQFAGSMGAAERAMGGGGYGPPVAGAGHYGQVPFRPPVGQAPYRGGGRRGGAPFRGGGGRGNSGPPFAGRGGGRGRGRPGPLSGPPSSQPTEGAQPVRIAWCELCQVDCTSQEILEQHKNGKRHKKNLLTKGPYQQPISETQKDEKPVSETQKDEKPITENEATDEQEKKPWLKRKMTGRGGTRGGKRLRPAGPPGPTRPKVVIPLMCDLCNVKCDTQEVFERHVAGKKHVAKLKRFEGHRAVYGPTAVQALYPPNPLAQTMGPQSGYYGAPSSNPPAESYVPVQAQNPTPNPNPQLADAPLQFGAQNAGPVTGETPAGNGV